MKLITKKGILFLAVLLFLFCSLPLFSQVSYEWKTRRTATGKEDFLVYLRISKTDLVNANNNVHQVFISFNPNCTQGTDLNFMIRMPNSSYDDYILQDFGTSPTYPATYTSPYNNGYNVTLNKTAGLDEYTLEIRFLPSTGNQNGFGCVGVNLHTQNTVDFYIQIRNVTLPDPLAGEYLSRLNLSVGTRTKTGYNALPQAALGGTGLLFDQPPSITINSPALSDTTVTAYPVPLNVLTPPYYSQAFTATAANDTANTITNLNWKLTNPDLTVSNTAGVASTTETFNQLGFCELLYSVDENVQSLFNVAYSLPQKGYGFVPIVVKYPPTAAITTSPAVPVGNAPFTLTGATAAVTSNDPLTHAPDYSVTGWELKKDGIATVTSIANTTTALGSRTIPAGGKYQLKIKLEDYYGIEGEGTADIWVTPIENLGFPPVGGVPFDSNPPDIDGVVEYYDVDQDGVRDPDADRDGIADPGEDIYENGWVGAYRLTFETGTYPPSVAFQGTRNRTMGANPYLYLSFEVRNDPTFDDNDAIVLAFRRTSTSTSTDDDRRIFIYPLHTTTGAGTNPANVERYNQDPRLVQYWKKNVSGDWVNAPAIDTSATGFVVKVWSNSPNAASKAYNLEIQLPVTAAAGGTDWMDLADDFRFFFDVIRIDSGTSNAYELTWPRELPLGYIPSGVLNDYDFPVEVWGTASKGAMTNCRGVSLEAWNDIGTYDSGNPTVLSSQMALSTENRFIARLTNNSENIVESPPGSGNYVVTSVAAANVRATFYIAHWGLNYYGADWREIGSTNPTYPNPTNSATIPADAGIGAVPKAELEARWTLDPTDYAYYTDPVTGSLHQCIKVELDSIGNTNILKKGVARNMNFAAGSSVFTETARISTRGFGKPPAGKSKHTVILEVTKKEWVKTKSIDPKTGRLLPGAAAAANAATTPEDIVNSQTTQNEVDSYLLWVVNGYIDTGKTITIGEKTYPIYMPMGSFGYIVHHAGEISGWDDAIEGAEQLSDTTFKLKIDPESFEDVKTQIESVTLTPFSLSAHGGAAIPLANFSADYSIGFCAILDASWKLTPELSLVFMAGYNYLPGANSSVPDLAFINLALNVRYTIPVSRTFYAYAQAGPDMYTEDFSSFSFGYNGGLGAGMILSPRISLEAGADYHSTFEQENWFLQTHAGVIFRF